MNRAWVASVVPALAVMLVAIWLFMPGASLPSRYAPGDCRKLALTDRDTGRPVTGIEDLALAPDGQTLIVSAHDRLSTRSGGIYRIYLQDIVEDAIAVRSLIAPDSLPGGLRPHGIALSKDGRHLAVINRLSTERVTIELVRLTSGWAELAGRIEHPSLCTANDLIIERTTGPAEVLVTLDRAACGFSLADMLPAATGRVARFPFSDAGPQIVATGLSFPNGILPDLVAETRANRITGPGGVGLTLPGGPDNLNRDGEGITAALHPSMIRLALYRYGLIWFAPSRIVRVRPGHPGIDVLYDDPEGDLFSAATSAVLVGDLLIAGSVRDSGLLVCGEFL